MRFVLREVSFSVWRHAIDAAIPFLLFCIKGGERGMGRHRYYLCIMVLLAIAFLGPASVRDARAVQPQIAGDGYHTVGLRSDGTVVAVGYNNYGQCDVATWADIDITQVAAGYAHNVGLTSDGTVVALGLNVDGRCNVGTWTDITQVAAGSSHTLGLKADSTVVAVGDNTSGQCDVAGWTDITQVAAGELHTVGLKMDGTVVAVGDNNNGQCNVSGWQLHIPGDINADGSIDLVDAFLALQLMAGFEPASSAYKGADVNDDGKIGIEEAVYIIQHVAVLR